ncbi:ABC transporter permease [Streptoalloteichus hindustanus]|uniref:Osmoprotectant transport system permease protein n=1 Tax=Streptoalloteichus hindustanus TaxID=2017 RepID=A0A1M5JX03_STRHI|nr:ABC transporter permease subunit [Streptoalloteichus hindustanus]SHG45048.1 osmoprotectant transport system permease protein [Streptoalloteichus hindustanus]
MLDDLSRYLGSESTRQLIVDQLVQHVELALLPLVVGVALAIPLGWLAQRHPLLRTSLLGVANVVYTVPSLAFFVVIPGVIGTQILAPVNVIAALSVYTAALLVRPVVDALDAVPGHVIAAATAMGYRPLRRFLAVELPLAVPVLTAGVRVASVSNISLASVGALLGIGGLGALFTSGFQTSYLPPIIVGIVLVLALALVVDLVLVGLRRLLTPWARAGGAR